ncbi:hypothetical protein ABZS66_41910 [Dactylosporangium sp. NPDC005572]|uniref:hypothetical protein n=1 Tax=Dactylosporangium sp. NPDC005572 TaxID=3156889 RepID=UPI0033B2491A
MLARARYVVVGVVLTAALGACGNAGSVGGPLAAPTAAATSSVRASASASPSAPASGEVQHTGGYQFPSYAYPFTPPGPPVATSRKGGVEVTYFEVGRATTKRDSTFRDRETGRNIWPAGSPVVYVEMVVTNVAAGRFFVSVAGPHPLVTLKSLDYLGGVSNLATFDTATADGFGVHQYGIRTKDYDWTKGDHFPLDPGQSIAQAVALPLRTGEAYRFTLQLDLYDRVEKGDDGHYVYFDPFSVTFPAR